MRDAHLVSNAPQSKHAKARMDEIDNIQSDDDAGDGELTVKEFCEFMVEYTRKLTEKAFLEKIAGWQVNVAGSHRKLLLRRVFNRMDVDKSGSISQEEFRALMSDENAPPDSNTSADLFRWIEGAEGDGDGELTVDEWVPFVLQQVSMPNVKPPSPSPCPCRTDVGVPRISPRAGGGAYG